MELAVAIPLLLLMVAGVIDLGFLFWEREVLTTATREGARAGAQAVVDGKAALRVSEVKTLVQTYLQNYKIKNGSGGNITLGSGNFSYTWNTSTNPALLTVRLFNIPVKMMLLPNIKNFFPGEPMDSTIYLNAETTMAAEWVNTSTPSP